MKILNQIMSNLKDPKTTLAGILLLSMASAVYLHLITGTEFASIVSALAGMGLIFGTGSKE
jgi:hypothetical protein